MDILLNTNHLHKIQKIFVITGWTSPIKMDENTVLNWTKDMCEVGYKYDCDFDGWGTNPDQ